MAIDEGSPGGTTRRDAFVIFTATCAVIALAFSIGTFFVAANAHNTAESAKTTAQRALAAAESAPTTTTAAPTSAPASGGVAVNATLTEYSITLDPNPPPSGTVTFHVHNQGKIAHELVVFRTDLAADALPVNKNGDVNEDAAQLKAVADTGSDLKPGASRTVRATLTPGHYVGVCNLPGHYAAGMRIDISVR